MRGGAGKRSRSRRESGGGISLFPFLAVLICTMGALILLLVVITRQAHLQAQEEHSGVATDEQREAIRGEIRMAELMVSQLEQSHRKTAANLAEARARLGQIEDHAGHLRRRIAEAQQAWNDLDKLASGGAMERRQLQARLSSLKEELKRREAELEQVKKTAETQRPSYSIVPYQGAHGTRRRPIYLECKADGIVLQPEGILFGESDFAGPLDSGNPLDVGLRAVREYLTEQQGRIGNGSPEEPYPLLLVRPSGISAYYAARAAMQSWGAEFGYELIGEDWDLEYLPADSELARAVVAAVEPARRRQLAALAAAPSHYGGGGTSRPVYSVQPYRGGVVRRDMEAGGSGGLMSSSASGRVGAQFRPGGAGGAGGARTGTTAQTERRDPPPGRTGEVIGEDEKTTAASSSQHEIVNGRKPQSLAALRGRNWGLPDATGSAVPITRPIRVECFADRLALVPEKGLADRQEIPLGGDLESSIDSFVSAIWDYMDTWGKAGRGMYWRPILNVYTGLGGEIRAVELEALLKDSGLDVHQAGRLAVMP
jgi:hypothetical protein